MQRSAPSPALSRLSVLVGEWAMEASVGGQAVGRGRASFAWLEGGAFLAQRAVGDPPLPDTPAEWVENSPLPVMMIIGLDEATGQYSVLYADARDVHRVYAMTLADGIWSIWRDAPGFYQRFTGTFSDDGTTITSRWEKSYDSANWEYDFDTTYTKVSA
jgi:hypothetical protein